MTSRPGNRPPAHRPSVTAGLKWPPEIGPNAYAPVTTVRPKASETPRNPIPSAGNAAASTALPQPPKTSQNVPRNSLVSLGNIASPPHANHPCPPVTPSSCGRSNAGRRTFGQSPIESPNRRKGQDNLAGTGREAGSRLACSTCFSESSNFLVIEREEQPSMHLKDFMRRIQSGRTL